MSIVSPAICEVSGFVHVDCWVPVDDQGGLSGSGDSLRLHDEVHRRLPVAVAKGGDDAIAEVRSLGVAHFPAHDADGVLGVD